VSTMSGLSNNSLETAEWFHGSLKGNNGRYKTEQPMEINWLS